MPDTYTAITKRDGDWWIGWFEEIPGVNCQERTREELLETLGVTLKEALEFNCQDAIKASTPDALRNVPNRAEKEQGSGPPK